MDAIRRALRLMRPRAPAGVAAYRLRKLKNEVMIGDMDLDEVAERASEFGPDDVVACFIGGNQYNAFGLVQHPRKFDFYSLERPEIAPMPDREIVAYSTLRELFVSGLSGSDGKRIGTLVASTRGRVVQLAPPPPKLNEQLILERHESQFKAKGLLEHGITPAPIRLKLWALQVSVLSQLCQEWGCELLPVPAAALDSDGYLKDEFAANDATHGNESYGRLNIEQVLAFASRRIESTESLP